MSNKNRDAVQGDVAVRGGGVAVEVGARPSDDREVIGRVGGMQLRADDFETQLHALMVEVSANDRRVLEALSERLTSAMVGYIKSPRFDALIKKKLDERAEALIENMVSRGDSWAKEVERRVDEAWEDRVESVVESALTAAIGAVKARFVGP